MCENIFEKIDYYDKYYSKGYRTFEKRDCVICNFEMNAPKALKSITTCSKYCSNVKLRMVKNKGYYSLCRVCDKLLWNQPKNTINFAL